MGGENDNVHPKAFQQNNFVICDAIFGRAGFYNVSLAISNTHEEETLLIGVYVARYCWVYR